jgi:hypothetical protein
MQRKIIEFLFNALAVKQFLIFTGCFFVLTAFAMVTTDAYVRHPECPGIIPLELAFTKAAFENIVAKCGAAGVRAHTMLLWIDYLFIIAYTSFLGNLLGSLVKGIERGRALNYFSLPIYAGVLDVIENILLQNQLSNPEHLSSLLIFAASAAASVKFVLLGATIAIIICYLYLDVSKRTHQAQ